MKSSHYKLSSIVKNLTGQPMFNLLAQAQGLEKVGKNIIHFEIGDPSFNTPNFVKNAAKKAIDKNCTHYVNSTGISELKETIADYTKTEWGFKPSLNQILVCPANAVVDFVARCVADPGDEIIYPDPGFPTYYSVIRYNGFKPIGIPLKENYNFHIKSQDIEKSITKKTKLIIINSPQNPTGAVLTQEEINQISLIAKKYKIFLLSDEVYSKFVYLGKHFSPALSDRCRQRTILLNSFSKLYSMSGWRLGYAIGPGSLIKKMGLLLQTILSCQPPFIQLAGKAALSGDQNIIQRRINNLNKRRLFLAEGLNSLPGISCLTPEGSIYLMANIAKTGMTDDQFCQKMLTNAGVCILPGNCFGKQGQGFVRFCYATNEIPKIEKALARIRKVLI